MIHSGHLRGSFRGSHALRMRLRFIKTRRAFDVLELGPDRSPRHLTEIPQMQLATCSGFNAPCLDRPHIPAARQALVEIGHVDASQTSQPLAVLEGEFLVHSPDDSESLGFPQAFRYGQGLAPSYSKLLEGAMETGNDRRKRKLAALVGEYGLAKVASQAKVNPAALDQVLKGVLLPAKADGSRSARSLGDAAARRIEAAFQLGSGWFDAAERVDADLGGTPFRDLNVFEGQLLGFFRQLPPDRQHAVVVALNRMAVTGRVNLADPFAAVESPAGPRGMSVFGELDSDEGQNS